MYETGKGAIVPAVVTGAVVLPATGGNTLMSLALSVGVGMVAWGTIYALRRG